MFIHTSLFRKGPQYSRSITVPLRRPSYDTPVIVSAVLSGHKAIYQTDYLYAKAGFLLRDWQPNTQLKGELDLEGDQVQDRTEPMGALDHLNERFGRGTVLVASAALAGKPTTVVDEAVVLA